MTLEREFLGKSLNLIDSSYMANLWKFPKTHAASKMIYSHMSPKRKIEQSNDLFVKMRCESKWVRVTIKMKRRHKTKVHKKSFIIGQRESKKVILTNIFIIDNLFHCYWYFICISFLYCPQNLFEYIIFIPSSVKHT